MKSAVSPHKLLVFFQNLSPSLTAKIVDNYKMLSQINLSKLKVVGKLIFLQNYVKDPVVREFFLRI